MVSYLKQAPAGVRGDVTRAGVSKVEPIMLVAVGGTTFPSKFGVPLKYVAGGAQQWNGGAETKASFAGVLIREVPSIAASSASDTVDDAAPNGDYPQGMLTDGYCTVKCFAGTPARGGVVYVQIVASAGAVVGDFRADGTDGGNAVALDFQQASWATDGLDTNGIAELRVQV